MDNMLTEQDYELLSQYVDGELPCAAARELEQRLASEPPLRAQLEQFHALNNTLQQAFTGPQFETVPRQVAALLDPAPARVTAMPQRAASRWPYALAASLAVAVCGALLTQWDRGTDTTTTYSEGIVDHSLAQALERLPSSGSDWTALPDEREVRPVLTFRSDSGNWCREYLVSDDRGSWHGVACRVEQRWNNTVITRAKLVIGPGEYRPAGAADLRPISAYIDSHSADIPLGADQEAALIARDWQ